VLPHGKVSFHVERTLTMRLTTPLDDVFKTRSHVRLLRALCALPEGVVVTGRDLARRASVSHPTASQVLDQLSDQGLVLVQRSVVANRYQANRRHTSAGQLESLFAWEGQLLKELIDYLGDGIRTRAPSVTRAYLFGSAPRADMRPSSDIDVAVLCPPRSHP